MTEELKAKVAKGLAAQGITKQEDVDKYFMQLFSRKAGAYRPHRRLPGNR